ncbi:MAG: DNA repair protein RecN [Myxococcales bacterium]|nr:DNA repair protein RecN [Myxococcales bacterium]
MLHALRIQSFAVIEEAEVSFGEGLTVLTGETGAGKSILVDALSLLLGGRADPEAVRAGCEEAVVEGLFGRTQELARRLSELGLPDLGDELAIRRVVGRGGRGKAYVNGSLVTVGVLCRLMKGLVDIAGQNEHVGLYDSSLHRELLDKVGSLGPLLDAYRARHAALLEVQRRVDALCGGDGPLAQRLDFLRFQLAELEEIDPRSGEDVALEEERRRLSSLQRLERATSEAETLLRNQEGSCLEKLDRALGVLQEAARLDASLGEPLRAVQGARSELEEVSRKLSRYQGSLEPQPLRLAEVEDRLDSIKRLCRKHTCSLAELVQRRGTLCAEVDQLVHRGEHLQALEEERARARQGAADGAARLSESRREAAGALSRDVREALSHLSLPSCEFSVRVAPREPAEQHLGPDGADDIEFFFSANPGEPARPLAKVASGGEASRLLLALKRALAESDGCRCYVLDEADSGVGGAAADVVGRMIKEVSGHRQVLCITHLPQVAAHADHHLLIEKEHRKGRTLSKVSALAGEERMRELARMLSGVEVSREALSAAQALVRSARRLPSSERMARRARSPAEKGGRARRTG